MPLLAAEDAQPLTGCAAKRQAISTQIEQAKAHGNSAQQAGLESPERSHRQLYRRLLEKERENKVLDAKHEVSRRQADLDKAMKKAIRTRSTSVRTNWPSRAKNYRTRWKNSTSKTISDRGTVYDRRCRRLRLCTAG